MLLLQHYQAQQEAASGSGPSRLIRRNVWSLEGDTLSIPYLPPRALPRPRCEFKKFFLPISGGAVLNSKCFRNLCVHYNVLLPVVYHVTCYSQSWSQWPSYEMVLLVCQCHQNLLARPEYIRNGARSPRRVLQHIRVTAIVLRKLKFTVTQTWTRHTTHSKALPVHHGTMCWMSSNTEEWQGLQ